MLGFRRLKGASFMAAAPRLLQRVWRDTAPVEDCAEPMRVDIDLDALESMPSVHWVRLTLDDAAESAWLTQPAVLRLGAEPHDSMSAPAA